MKAAVPIIVVIYLLFLNCVLIVLYSTTLTCTQPIIHQHDNIMNKITNILFIMSYLV